MRTYDDRRRRRYRIDDAITTARDGPLRLHRPAVTFVGAPFRIHNPNNFSSDQRTTVMFLINGLTFTSADNPDTIRVEAGNRTLFVQSIGALTAPGLSATYVIFAFPLDLTPGNYPLNVRVRNVPCINSPLISIAGP